MASTNVITSLGASDVDTKELTKNLIAAIKEPRQKLIDAARKKNQVAISSAALLKSGLASLQAAATEISSASKLNKVQTSSSDASVVTATAFGNNVARAGSYAITVSKLALPTQVSASFPANYKSSAPITLQMSVPGTNAGANSNISIAADKTPSEIVDQINAWVRTNAPQSGLVATILNTGGAVDPLRIVLQGKSGTANHFSVAAVITGETPPASASEIQFSESSRAGNAEFTVNGIAVERASNTITDVVAGLSLSLARTSTSPISVAATPDPSSIVENIRNFVEVYNTISDFVKKAIGPKIDGDDVAGSLQNDSAARSIIPRLRTAITAKFSELATKPTSVTHWSSLGVTFDNQGVLKFDDESKFVTAYQNRPDDVVTALSNNARTPYITSGGKSGLAGDIAVISYRLIGTSTSALPMMTKAYESSQTRLDKKQAALDAQITRLTDQYEKQFSSLNSVLASFKNTQTQLERSLNLDNKN